MPVFRSLSSAALKAVHPFVSHLRQEREDYLCGILALLRAAFSCECGDKELEKQLHVFVAEMNIVPSWRSARVFLIRSNRLR
ncbi:Hypothetical protein NTJ_08740 [Nesidiocoris tenuis]|uniref:Uncharacterized protein n=1 Tax=Nesidiocoris tenuis TaxID=355587 RepID=A0ABN7AUS6_9HEMI|nr:Hypothetical protein NTJ_08740 [Nesidiocoris tenuis]